MEWPFRKVTLPRTSESLAAAGFRSGPPPRVVSTMKGRSDQLGWAETQAAIGLRSLERTASSVKTPSAMSSLSDDANIDRSVAAIDANPASSTNDLATQASRPTGV